MRGVDLELHLLRVVTVWYCEGCVPLYFMGSDEFGREGQFFAVLTWSRQMYLFEDGGTCDHFW